MLLREKDKRALLDIFSSSDTPMEVWAYGSRVSGAAHEGSDLDLVVRYKNLEKIPIDELMTLKEDIKHSNVAIVVELFDWARLPESFHRNIEAEYEVLFSNLKIMVNEPKGAYKKKPTNR